MIKRNLAIMHNPIQIVDKSGKFVGLADDPGVAKQRSQIRLISRVILKNSEGKYLLQKRAADMIAWPGYWDSSAAGHVDEGETPEQAAYRELKEEIGIDSVELALVQELFHENPPDPDGTHNRMYSLVYEGTFDGDLASVALEPSEVSSVAWFSLEEVRELMKQPETVTDGVDIIFKERTA